MSIDTQEQALAEARKRGWEQPWADELEPFYTGEKSMFQVGNFHKLFGQGKSWDAAFQDADARKQDV